MANVNTNGIDAFIARPPVLAHTLSAVRQKIAVRRRTELSGAKPHEQTVVVA